MRIHARRVALALVAAVWLLAAAAQSQAAVDTQHTTTIAGSAVSGQACAAADADPGAQPRAALRAALRCVVNAQRAASDLAPLRRGPALARAADGHASDMVSRRYFAHERAGSTLPGRLRAAGWSGRRAGEAIAWGCGGLGTPREILQAWLASPPHRAIVLGHYRRGGIGLANGAPVSGDCSGAGTWVLDVAS